MTRRVVLLVAAIALCLVQPEGLWAQGPGQVHMIFDEAHGEGPPPAELFDVARKLTLDIQRSATPITADVLRSTRVLFLRAPSDPFSPAETEAIVGFVKGGGSLLLVLDEERRQSLDKTRVNTLISPFAMKLTPDTAYLHNNGGIAKAGAINKADRQLPFSGGRAVEGGSPFAFQLDRDGNPAQPFGAYKQLESGARIVVLGEGMATLFLGTPYGIRLTGVPYDPTRTIYWGKDSRVFMEEVLGWVAGVAPSAAVGPR